MLASVSTARGDESLCGARCVHRVLELMKERVDLTDVVEDLYDSPRGGIVSYEDLANVLRRRGISCRVARLGTLDVPSTPYPVILHVNGNHFVVLEQCDRWSATVWDGTKGEQDVSWWRLRRRCSDAVLVCAPAGMEPSIQTDSTVRFIVAGFGIVLLGVGAYCLRRLWRATGAKNQTR